MFAPEPRSTKLGPCYEPILPHAFTKFLSIFHGHIVPCQSFPCPCCSRPVLTYGHFASSLKYLYPSRPIPIMLHLRYGPCPLCTMLVMPNIQHAQFPLCSMPNMPHAQYFPCPLYSMSSYPICLMPTMLYAYYLLCPLCPMLLMPHVQMHHAHCAPCPLCLLSIFLLPHAHSAPCSLGDYFSPTITA